MKKILLSLAVYAAIGVLLGIEIRDLYLVALPVFVSQITDQK